jgi:hypothetical protein
MKSYIGKIIFLEKCDPSKSNYGAGEYIVVEQSPNNLYCVKTQGGYDAHEMRAMPLVGVEAWKVVTEHDDPKFLKRFVADLRLFAVEKNTTGRSWIDSVYNGAARIADKLERLIGCPCDEPQKVSVYDGNTHTFLLNGHRVTVTIEA